MSLKYELTKKFRRKEIISVCMVAAEQMKKGERDTLEFRIGENWITTKPLLPDYKNYSHGICNDCLRKYFPEKAERIIYLSKTG